MGLEQRKVGVTQCLRQAIFICHELRPSEPRIGRDILEFVYYDLRTIDSARRGRALRSWGRARDALTGVAHAVSA